MTNTVETVKSIYNAFGRGDIPAVLATLHENVDWRYHGSSAIPFAGHYLGRAEMGEFFFLH
jgi:ketosteroid isomerase-like protein